MLTQGGGLPALSSFWNDRLGHQTSPLGYKTMKTKIKTVGTIKYFMYCRKSSEDNKERQMQSVESQERELKKLVEELKLEVVEIFREEKTAHVRGRKTFSEMMTRIEYGEANAILTYHGNRLARNAFDGGWVITAMDEGKLIEIKTPHRTYRNTPDDKFFLQLEFGISKKDSDDKSIVVKRGLKAKCIKGWMPGVAPLGYLNTPNIVGGSRYIRKDEVDESDSRFNLVKRAWELMASGRYSVSQICNLMNNEWGFKTRMFKRQGGNKITLSRLYKMFKDPFYYGYFEYPRNSGEFYRGQHDPMITEEIFDAVQHILGNPRRTKASTKSFPYTGLMTCKGCGAQITAEEKWKHQKNGNVHHYTYYRCTRRKDPNCKQKAIKVEDLERQIDERLTRVELPKPFQDWAVKYLQIIYQQKMNSIDKIIESNGKAVRSVGESIDNLVALKISPANRDGGLLSDDEFKHRKTQLMKERDGLEDAQKGFAKKLGEARTKSEKDFNFAVYARDWLKNGAIEDKRVVLGELGYNPSINEQILSISLKETYNYIAEEQENIVIEISRLEPLSNGSVQRKTGDFSPVFPSLLRGRDSNPELRVMSPARCRFSTPRYKSL